MCTIHLKTYSRIAKLMRTKPNPLLSYVFLSTVSVHIRAACRAIDLTTIISNCLFSWLRSPKLGIIRASALVVAANPSICAPIESLSLNTLS